MLSALGLFVFELHSNAYQQWQRHDQEHWESHSRIGARANWQHIGVGDDVITLSGSLYPEITGGKISLDMLREMKISGKSWIFMLGTGSILGRYIIDSISETHQYFFHDGSARKIDFSLKLIRNDDTNIDLFGDLGSLVNHLIKNSIER